MLNQPFSFIINKNYKRSIVEFKIKQSSANDNGYYSPFDQRVMDRINAGDEEGLSELYDRYAPSLFSLIIKFIPSRTLAEEILQNTFLQVWKNAGSYSGKKGKLFYWIWCIASKEVKENYKQPLTIPTGLTVIS